MSGHYTAYTRHPYSSQWHCFNDARSVFQLTTNDYNLLTNPSVLVKVKKVKADIAFLGNPISELRDLTCHMGSHRVTCHATQVNAPRLTPAIKASTRFTYPGGMEG